MMKKTALLLTFHLFFALILLAQAPEKFNYQGVARDNSGNILANQAIGLQITIHSGSPNGASVYQETHTVTTNDFGFFNIEIGGGTIVSGVFSNINWGGNSFYNQIEMDATGGTNYQDLGTVQLLSVPYALFAKTTGTTSGKPYFVLQGDISDAEAAQRIEEEIGPNTQFIWVRYTTQLTSVDFTRASELVEIDIAHNTSLISINFPDLTEVYSRFSVEHNDVLSLMSAPLFEKSADDFYVRGNSNLQSLSIPSINTIQGGSFNIYDNALTSFSLPAYNYNGPIPLYFNVSGNQLGSSSVNELLAQFTAISPPISGWTIKLEGQTPAAAPTGQGIIDKNTLISNANTVITD
jgi:hypothetical protein